MIHKSLLPVFVWVGNLVSQTEKETQVEDFREQSAEKDIWS